MTVVWYLFRNFKKSCLVVFEGLTHIDCFNDGYNTYVFLFFFALCFALSAEPLFIASFTSQSTVTKFGIGGLCFALFTQKFLINSKVVLMLHMLEDPHILACAESTGTPDHLLFTVGFIGFSCLLIISSISSFPSATIALASCHRGRLSE